MTVSCALSSASGSLTCESQGNKLFLTSRSDRRKQGMEKPKMVMRGSSVSEDEPVSARKRDERSARFVWMGTTRQLNSEVQD